MNLQLDEAAGKVLEVYLPNWNRKKPFGIPTDGLLLRELSSYDVLYHGCRVDALLCLFCIWYSAGCRTVPSFHYLTEWIFPYVGRTYLGNDVFIFMAFAALSRVIAVFENIIAMTVDFLSWEHKKSLLVNLVGIIVLSVPAVLGYNLWKHI